MNNKNEMNSISNMTDEELDALFKEADGRRIYIRSK